MKRPAVIANEAGADNIGGLFPLETSGSRYKMLNVTSEASSIETKKMRMCLVCLSIGKFLSDANARILTFYSLYDIL